MPSPKETEKAIAEKVYMETQNPAEAARQAGVYEQTVRRWINKYGWEKMEPKYMTKEGEELFDVWEFPGTGSQMGWIF